MIAEWVSERFPRLSFSEQIARARLAQPSYIPLTCGKARQCISQASSRQLKQSESDLGRPYRQLFVTFTATLGQHFERMHDSGGFVGTFASERLRLKNGESVSTNKRSTGTIRATARSSSDFLNVSIPAKLMCIPKSKHARHVCSSPVNEWITPAQRSACCERFQLSTIWVAVSR